MPEAPMYKYHKSPLGKNDIWSSGQITPVKTEAIAQFVQSPTNCDLWRGVPWTYARHHRASFRRN
jgi:hypothetical protein